MSCSLINGLPVCHYPCLAGSVLCYMTFSRCPPYSHPNTLSRREWAGSVTCLAKRDEPVPSVCCCKPWQCLPCVAGSHEPSYKGLSWRSHKETLWEEAIWMWRGLESAVGREGPMWSQPSGHPCQSIIHLREATIAAPASPYLMQVPEKPRGRPANGSPSRSQKTQNFKS